MSKDESCASSKPKTPVCLLLFVGIIFGIVFGYSMKDSIRRTMTKLIKPPVVAEDTAMDPATSKAPPADVVAPVAPAEGPKDTEEKKADPAPEGEKKPE